MLDINVPILLFAASPCLALLFLVHRSWVKRLSALERDLQEVSGVMCQIAEIQSRVFKQLTGNLNEVEGRLQELTVPSGDGEMPLEKRHRVLALARKGAAPTEIARKLSVPRGEAELIVSLRNYVNTTPARPSRGDGDPISHAPV